ncbi:MAG: GFA family protein [Alphaproteobacteria bacterium]|jgi:hypothetical protein|nr:GFA family protein [Rhodospirillaceae bacterium]MBT6509693.1 GFA family protein [Rhodospirillaceae bacterium]MBT7613273.1 GFA family protein [Rhodospirillaceae bacterium]MDG2480707.1 GFA family protein [Alphaproteobacteria bacterium]
MTTAHPKPIAGGCLCGAVRFELTEPAHDVYHCHCSIFRKLQGALYPTYGVVARTGFRLMKGADSLTTYDSSGEVHRHFCSTCGSHVFEDTNYQPENVWFSVGTLDDGADPGGRAATERHIFWEPRTGWFEPGDDLPKVIKFGDNG